MLKLLLINVRNTLILLALAYFSIPIIDATWSTFSERGSKRAHLINYKATPWAAEHFKEVEEIESGYLGYIGWRRKPFSGRTVTIDPLERIRVTPQIPGLAETAATYFFGGSTMWGTGANNESTIPAYYQEIAKERAINYGETGWTAHQSLNQLIKVMQEGRRPAKVVFYDGVNDVATKCRRENDFFAHSNEQRLRDAFEIQPTSFRYYMRSVLEAAYNVSGKIFGTDSADQNFYDCASNPKKARLIADALVGDWEIAKYVAETNGSRFFAFLQPVAFLSNTRLSHLSLDADFAKQYAAVYPLIRLKMKERGIGIDMSAVLDRDEYFYIDFCHVSPNGNRVIAEAIKMAMTDPDSKAAAIP